MLPVIGRMVLQMPVKVEHPSAVIFGIGCLLIIRGGRFDPADGH